MLTMRRGQRFLKRVAFVVVAVQRECVELFLIPGFGVTGILGTVLIVAGIVLSLTPFYIPDTDWEMDYFLATLRNVILGAIGSVILIIILLRFRMDCLDQPARSR